MSSAIEAQLVEQQKIISYLTSKYEKDTGRRLAMPTQLGELLGDPSILGSIDQAIKGSEDTLSEMPTFIKAVEKLRLPKASTSEKGKP